MWTLDVVLPLFHNTFMLFMHARTHTGGAETHREKQRQRQKERLRGYRKAFWGGRSHFHNSCSVTNQLQGCSQGAENADPEAKGANRPLASQPYICCITSESASQSHLDKD